MLAGLGSQNFAEPIRQIPTGNALSIPEGGPGKRSCAGHDTAGARRSSASSQISGGLCELQLI